ncbi:MAG TPA: FlgD immunoglobulin-like domain containing protein, partial [Armatimonadota bacterium]|nr:FlgD immunoglobulin-like domain containing protein [Armatimonadota bacterium]
VALTIAGLSAQPTAAGCAVTFTLSAEASVSCEVLNIAGRPVRTVVADRACGSGLTTLTWDGRTATGLMAPAGTYLVRVVASAPTGAQCRTVSTLQLSR